MLRAAVDYARSCGARLVEAYPVDKDERSHPDSMFFGMKSMYDRDHGHTKSHRRPEPAAWSTRASCWRSSTRLGSHESSSSGGVASRAPMIP